MRVVAKDVVPVGQQVVGFNELKDSSADRSSQGAGEKEMNAVLLPLQSNNLRRMERRLRTFTPAFGVCSCAGGRLAWRIWF